MDYPSDEDFWGRMAIEKAGYAAIGLVCKRNCWFPSADIEWTLSILNPLLRPYKNIVLYGFSMGGYGAVKFSRHLAASCVISLSPQYSIDPNDVFPHDRRLIKHFNPAVNINMSIKSHDMSGRIFLFYDPKVQEDSWNVERILENADENAKIIPVRAPNIGHETIDLFAGSSFIEQLVSLCLSGDLTQLREFTSLQRRRSQRRIFHILSKAKTRFPQSAEILYEQNRELLLPYWQKKWDEPLEAEGSNFG
ncbi:MAG TPA: hypothetical protein VHY35_02400 [Stellaceae bacterium]|jgi:hypothetical protein|nr:hypothetical protein [Stellaceae bacterium]